MSNIKQKLQSKVFDRQYLKIDSKKKKGVSSLLYLSFEDSGQHIIYIPSLNLSAYGDSKDEAEEMLKVVVEDFFENLSIMSDQEIIMELKKYGWEKHNYFKKRFLSDSSVDTLGILKNFNLPKNTPVKEAFIKI